MWKRPHTFSCLSSLKSVYYQWSYSPHYVIPELIFLVAFFSILFKICSFDNFKVSFPLVAGLGKSSYQWCISPGIYDSVHLVQWRPRLTPMLGCLAALASALTWFLHLLNLLRCPPLGGNIPSGYQRLCDFTF